MKRIKWTWGWRYLDMSIAVIGVVIATLVWFIPSFESNPDIQAFYKRQREVKAYNAAILAEEARVKQEREDLGLVFLVPTPIPDDKTAPKPLGKPKPKSRP